MASFRDSNWIITHCCCVITHLVLVLASFIAFGYYVFATDKHAMGSNVSWASLAIGSFGLGSNLVLFGSLLYVEQEFSSITIEEQFYLKRSASLLGFLLNSMLAGGESYSSYKMVQLLESLPVLGTACVFSALSALLSLTTIYADATKLSRDRSFLSSLKIDCFV
ncbi:hypothetical protein EJ05DRAFT_477209 [Pseudovirgaria hyperparasitica]|uniref:Uncharacterized protein n=1 Tax=Pseudovirgaria hyperparasitica TaxID=470096 RepID=A0A6A6W237_9PEZI|nr:uncharacterized protein EJ05DRAFT_477209 [Pseudovirgaria hyperparasitica]KAF2756988.1 hypothetical protein EJ05DRAFT_477209 [Pseudovirgaria hyperparasitica]